jgi:uncharacterized SAM-binding protein YcdF (DUF218 family)
MFNLASKVLFLFFDPPALIFLLLIGAWIVRKRSSASFQRMFAAALFVLLIFASPTPSRWMIRSLENQYPDLSIRNCPTSEAIVVLGDTLNLPNAAHPSSGLTIGSDRLLKAFRLYCAGKAPLIAVSGGNNPLLSHAPVGHEADEMRAILIEWGVPDSAILVENQSIDTRENALFTRKLLADRGIQHITLVTSAFHMPRAAATFRKVGFGVDPVPADFVTGWNEPVTAFQWIPTSRALLTSSNAIHEWLGLLVYRLRGWA